MTARKKADELGYHTLILSSMIEGETREVAHTHTAIAREVLKTGNPLPRPACILSGGETTVTITGKGLGGLLLTEAIRRAWDFGASRVWVQTCTQDAPTALPNYLARGFRIFKEEPAQGRPSAHEGR